MYLAFYYTCVITLQHYGDDMMKMLALVKICSCFERPDYGTACVGKLSGTLPQCLQTAIKTTSMHLARANIFFCRFFFSLNVDYYVIFYLLLLF